MDTLFAKRLLPAAACLLALACTTAPAYSEDMSREALKKLIEQTLRDNPSLVLDVLRTNSEAVLDIAQQGSNVRRLRNLEAQWRQDAKAPKTVRTEGRPVFGNANAKVRIIAFSDFTCHYCQMASSTIETLLKEYGDKICLVPKHMPLEEKSPSWIAAQYFIAIALQDEAKAWEFYRKMFENKDKVVAEGEDFIKKTAKEIGVDMNKASWEIRNRRGKVAEILRDDADDAAKLGIEGTPYFLVNDLVVRGALPLEFFRRAVDMALKEAK